MLSDLCQGRRLLGDGGGEVGNIARLTSHFNVHTAGGIAHPTCQVVFKRQVIDKRPESNPLNDPVDVDMLT